MILVTGADGQLGSELKRVFNASDALFVNSKIGDITDQGALDSLFLNHNISKIINCAAYTAVDHAEENEEKAYLVNAQGVENLCKYEKPIIHISTDYVFSGDGTVPYKEEDEVNPVNIYGRTKLEGEDLLKRRGCSGIIIRTSWVYSCFGNNFVKTMLRLGKEKDALSVVNDQVGSPTSALDLALAIEKIINKIPSDKVETYHYTNLGTCTWFEFANEIFSSANLNVKVSPVTSDEFPTKAKRPSYSVLSKDKIIQDFGLEIPNWKISLRSVLASL